MSALRSRRRPGSLRWGLLIVVVGIVSSGTALAQDGNTRKFRSGSEVVVQEGETVSDDLYASGGTVDVAGALEGDLVAAGGQVRVTGSVQDDVLAAGGRLTISGEVGGDVRVAGGDVALEGSVAEDVLVTAGQIKVADGATIGGDLLFSGGQMRLDGSVEGDVLGSTGNYTRNGTVGGTEKVTSGRPEDAPPTVGERLLGALRRYIAVLVVGALLLAIAPRLLHGSAERARNDPLPSLGVGALGALGYVLALIAIVVVTVFASIVLGLLGLGSLVAALGLGALLASAGLTFAFVLVVAFVADVILGLVTGRLLWRSGPQTPTRGAFGALALGVAVVVVLTSIPILGGLLRFLVVLVGLGALLLALRRRRAAAPTPTPA